MSHLRREEPVSFASASNKARVGHWCFCVPDGGQLSLTNKMIASMLGSTSHEPDGTGATPTWTRSN